MKTINDAQAVIYKQNGKEISILLLFRYNPDKKIDEYRLVKGGLKKDESLEDAVKRETGEEVGLKKIEIISKVHEYKYLAGEVEHNVHVFLIKALEDEINIDSSEEGKFEIKGSRWESIEKSLELLNFKDEKQSIMNSIMKINFLKSKKESKPKIKRLAS